MLESLVEDWVRAYIVKTVQDRPRVFSELRELGYGFMREKINRTYIVDRNRAFQYYSGLCLYRFTLLRSSLCHLVLIEPFLLRALRV